MKRFPWRTFALLCGASFGSVTSAGETSMTIETPGSGALSVEMRWQDAEIVGGRLMEWSDGVGGVVLLAGQDSQSRHLSIEIIDGAVVITLGKAGEDGGGEDPPQGPPPDPASPVPDGHLGLTKAAHDWVVDLVDAAKDPNRGEHARAQAAVYGDVAAGLTAESPKYDSVAKAFEDLRSRNRAILPEGEIRDSWAPFSLRVSQRIEELWPFEEAEAAKILGAIGNGLKAVK